jgi:outer membrane protein OmpA-like peptidoglycan-associated protein
VLMGLGYDPPISGRYRPVMNDCSGPTVSFPEIVEPRARPKMEPIYLTDADPELRGEGVFLFDSTGLSSAAKAKLDALLAEAEDGTQFVIETGCDQCGTETYNKDLSQRRSAAIAKYLESQGFVVTKTVSHGEALARIVPGPGDCKKGFPKGAPDRFLKIYTP